MKDVLSDKHRPGLDFHVTCITDNIAERDANLQYVR